MQAAIMSGMYGLPITPVFNCSTSTCYWRQPIVTLGAAAHCLDVTSTSNRTCTLLEESSDDTICTYQTPSGLSLTSLQLRDGDRVKNTAWNFSIRFEDMQKDSPMPDAMRTGNYRIKDPDATSFEIQECRWNWAVKIFEGVSVANNSLIINRTSTIDLCGDPTSGTEFLELVPFNNSQKIPDGAGPFRVEHAGGLAIGAIIQGILNGAESISDQGVGSAAPSALVTGDLLKVVDGTTLAVTNRIRTGRNSTSIQGVAMGERSFIRVRWAWLFFPGVVVCLSAILLITTMYQNIGQVLWKSRQHPLAFCTLPPELYDTAGLLSREAMEKVARGEPIMLRNPRNLIFQTGR